MKVIAGSTIYALHFRYGYVTRKIDAYRLHAEKQRERNYPDVFASRSLAIPDNRQVAAGEFAVGGGFPAF
jgi:hypothetical protein